MEFSQTWWEDRGMGQKNPLHFGADLVKRADPRIFITCLSIKSTYSILMRTIKMWRNHTWSTLGKKEHEIHERKHRNPINTYMSDV